MEYEDKLKEYMTANAIHAEHLSFTQSCHTVKEAAEAVGAQESAFVKNICMIDENNQLIVAIVKGEDRASTTRVAKALSIARPRTATPAEILERTGYPCGGTPSFGYDAQFLVDERVVQENVVYSGGGSEQSLIKITPQELVRANAARVTRIRK